MSLGSQSGFAIGMTSCSYKSHMTFTCTEYFSLDYSIDPWHSFRYLLSTPSRPTSTKHPILFPYPVVCLVEQVKFQPVNTFAKYINRFTTTLKEPFRLNNGPVTSLRNATIQKAGSYGIATKSWQRQTESCPKPRDLRKWVNTWALCSRWYELTWNVRAVLRCVLILRCVPILHCAPILRCTQSSVASKYSYSAAAREACPEVYRPVHYHSQGIVPAE